MREKRQSRYKMASGQKKAIRKGRRKMKTKTNEDGL